MIIMKKHMLSFKFIGVVAQIGLILMLIVSCSQDETIYSCNPEINLWVKENKQSIDVMSSNEFLSLERDYQKASYIAFSPKQRENLWVSKITEASKLDWSKDEQEHIGKLLIALEEHSNVFSKDCPEEYKDDFKIWVYQWIKEGEEVFNWSPKLIKNLLFSPNQLLSKDGEIKGGKNKVTRQIKTRSEDGGDSNRNCNCNSNSSHGEGIFSDDCSEDSHCVQGYWNCESKWAGCGLFFLDSCDGYCW